MGSPRMYGAPEKMGRNRLRLGPQKHRNYLGSPNALQETARNLDQTTGRKINLLQYSFFFEDQEPVRYMEPPISRLPPITQLPPELLVITFEFLSPLDRACCASVNLEWQALEKKARPKRKKKEFDRKLIKFALEDRRRRRSRNNRQTPQSAEISYEAGRLNNVYSLQGLLGDLSPYLSIFDQETYTVMIKTQAECIESSNCEDCRHYSKWAQYGMLEEYIKGDDCDGDEVETLMHELLHLMFNECEIDFDGSQGEYFLNRQATVNAKQYRADVERQADNA